MKITIPVGAGELVDKITILTIKSERITDETKLINVRHELSLLTLVQAEALGYWSEVPSLSAQGRAIAQARRHSLDFRQPPRQPRRLPARPDAVFAPRG